ncbi:hypothetical protein Vafri_19835, partial [Volvox africanus]
ASLPAAPGGSAPVRLENPTVRREEAKTPAQEVPQPSEPSTAGRARTRQQYLGNLPPRWVGETLCLPDLIWKPEQAKPVNQQEVVMALQDQGLFTHHEAVNAAHQ